MSCNLQKQKKEGKIKPLRLFAIFSIIFIGFFIIVIGADLVSVGTEPQINYTSPINNTLYSASTVLFNFSSSDYGMNGSIIPNLDGSLVSWYRMDDLNSSGGVVDYMGRNNLTATAGALQTDTGKYGRGFSFNGSSGYIGVSNVDSSLDIRGNITLGAWIKINKLSQSNQEIIIKGYDSAAGWQQYHLKYVTTGAITFRIGNSSTDNLLTTSNNVISDNNWHYVTATWNGTMQSIYVDGVLSKNQSTTISLMQSRSYFAVGSDIGDGGRYYFNGSIDDVMIFNRSLTSSEILSIYNATALSHSSINLSEANHTLNVYAENSSGNVTSTGTINFGVDLTAPSPNFTIPTETSGSYVSRSNVLVNVSVTDTNFANMTVYLFNSDKSLNRSNVSTSNPYFINYTSLADGLYYFNATTFDSAGNYNSSETRNVTLDATYPIINLSSPVNRTYYNYSNVLFNISSSELGNGSIIPNLDGSLVSWWRMDDLNSSGGVVDYMGRNNGTNVGGVVQVDNGKFGKAMSFNTTNYIRIPNSVSLNLTGNFTISAWAYITTTTNYQSLIDKGTGFCTNGYAFQYYTNAWHFFISNDSCAGLIDISSGSVSINTWYHIIGVKNDTNISIYLNGVLKSIGVNPPTGTIASGYPLLIGYANSGSSSFNGSIDDVMIFNRSLTSSEILSIYNATALSHSSINLSEANHTLNVYAQDLAGNVNSTGAINFGVDLTAPSGNLSNPANNSYSNASSNNFTANISDNLAGIKNATLYIYNSSNTLVNTSVVNYVSNTLSTTAGVVVILIDGVYKWFYGIFDWAGNYYTTSNYTMTVDTTYPLINFTTGTSNNNTARYQRFFTNISLTELNLANVTWNFNSMNYVFNTSGANLTPVSNINISIINISSTNWIILINQSGLVSGQSYNYYVHATDLSGNSNSTETRTIIGDTAPGFLYIIQTPLITDYDNLDPGLNVSFIVNVSDIDNNFDTAVLQWKNSTINSTWNNITMENITAKSYYTILNASFTLPNYEDNITYKIWANDSEAASNSSSNYTIQSFWDCTWNATADFSSAVGWDENKLIGNITINNTGDPAYSNSNCTLSLHLLHNLDSGRIYFNSWSNNRWLNYYNSPYVLAKSNLSVRINFSFMKQINQDSLVVTVLDLSGISSVMGKNLSSTLVTNQNGPYLYQTITSYPAAVYLTPTNLNFNSYLNNIMGSSIVNPNNTAYNVSFYWNIPSGFSLTGGNLTINYANISDNDLYYNSINVTFGDLSTMTPGTKTFYLYSYGYNFSGSLIADANNETLLSDSVNISFLCYNATDGICVSACGYTQDSDCSPPTPKIITSPGGSSGGGGGGGNTGVLEKSEATFELLAGKEQEFTLPIENKFAGKKENIKITVSGINSEYITITPNKIDSIDPYSSRNITIKITAPAYFTEKEYQLYFIITGEIVSNKTRQTFSEKKLVTLHIVELSREGVDKLISDSSVMIEEMNKSNMNTKGVSGLYSSMQDYYNNLDFNNVENTYNKIKEMHDNAFTSIKLMSELKDSIANAEKNGIKILDTKKLLYMAEAAFNRGDFSSALESLKQAKLSFAIETKGEFNLGYAIKNHPVYTFYVILGLLVFSFGGTFAIKIKLYREKLKYLDDEEKLLLELMKTIQRQCFEKGNLEIEEYKEAMSQYESKLSSTIKERINIETKLSNLLKLRGKKRALGEEKERLVSLIRDVQDRYLNKGLLETRVYQDMLKIYSERISEIEEQITFLEAEEAIHRNNFIARIVNFGGLRK
jgi:hypothetical protein